MVLVYRSTFPVYLTVLAPHTQPLVNHKIHTPQKANFSRQAPIYVTLPIPRMSMSGPTPIVDSSLEFQMTCIGDHEVKPMYTRNT